MNRPGILREIVIALVLSLLGGATFALLSALGLRQPLRETILIVTTGYSLTLIARAGGTGRITAVAVGLLSPLALALGDVSIPVAVLVQSAWIWLLRSALVHRSLIAVASDLALTIVAVIAAASAFAHTASPATALWCLLLIQAFHVYLPQLAPARAQSANHLEDGFEQAHRRAEQALTQLFNQNS